MKSSGSNGIVEGGVQDIGAYVRALSLALQKRIGMTVDTREKIVASTREFSAHFADRMNVGIDGKAAYERIKIKKPTIMGAGAWRESIVQNSRGTDI